MGEEVMRNKEGRRGGGGGGELSVGQVSGSLTPSAVSPCAPVDGPDIGAAPPPPPPPGPCFGN